MKRADALDPLFFDPNILFAVQGPQGTRDAVEDAQVASRIPRVASAFAKLPERAQGDEGLNGSSATRFLKSLLVHSGEDVDDARLRLLDYLSAAELPKEVAHEETFTLRMICRQADAGPELSTNA